jgi:hypothetical protein
MAKTPAEIKSLARAHTAKAVNTLVGIMNKPTAPEAARVAAANSILDRGWGKAVQHIEAEVTRRYVARLPEKAETSDKWQKQNAPKPSPTIQ